MPTARRLRRTYDRVSIRASAAPEVLAQRAADRPDGRGAYDRRSALTGLLPLWPEELADDSPAGRQRVVEKLRRLLRAERRRGRAGHWSYSVTRHAQLVRTYRAELAALADAIEAARAEDRT